MPVQTQEGYESFHNFYGQLDSSCSASSDPVTQQRYADWPNLTQPKHPQSAAQGSPNLESSIQSEDPSLESILVPGLPLHGKPGIALASEQPTSDQTRTTLRHDHSSPRVSNHVRSLSNPYSESRTPSRPPSGSQPEVFSRNRFTTMAATMLTSPSSHSNADRKTISRASNMRDAENDRRQPLKRGNSQLDWHHDVASKHRKAQNGVSGLPHSASPGSSRRYSNGKSRKYVDSDRSEASGSDSPRPRRQRRCSHCHSCGAPSPLDDPRSSHPPTKIATPASPRTSARINTSDNSNVLSDCSMALANLAEKSDLAEKREFRRQSGGSRRSGSISFEERLANGELDTMDKDFNPSTPYQKGVEKIVIVYRYGNG